MQAVKFLRVKVPCPFTRKSNECITEATGWSQCRVVHLHLSCLSFSSMLVKSPRSTPSAKQRMRWHCTGTCGSAMGDGENLYHSTLDSTFRSAKVDSAFSHPCPLKWRHLWGISEESNMTSLHRKKISIQRGLFVSGLGILNVPSKYYDVIDRIAGMQYGTLAPLVDSCNAVGVLLAYALIVFRSMLGGCALLLFTRLAHFQWR